MKVLSLFANIGVAETSFFNAREDVWNFCFGGYHGLQKWLKDRRGAKLEHHINLWKAWMLY